MSNSTNPRVRLSPNSLYIATSQLMAPGKYHWSLYFTDSAGIATKYHWAEISSREFAEGVIIVPVDPVLTYTKAMTMTFAFFCITGYTPAPAERFQHIIENAFEDPLPTKGYGSVRLNRDNQINCVTWAMSVVSKLQAGGFIGKRDDKLDLKVMVKKIFSETTELEKKLASYELDVSQVINI